MRPYARQRTPAERWLRGEEPRTPGPAAAKAPRPRCRGERPRHGGQCWRASGRSPRRPTGGREPASHCPPTTEPDLTYSEPDGTPPLREKLEALPVDGGLQLTDGTPLERKRRAAKAYTAEEAAEIAKLRAARLEAAELVVTHPFWDSVPAADRMKARAALKHHGESA